MWHPNPRQVTQCRTTPRLHAGTPDIGDGWDDYEDGKHNSNATEPYTNSNANQDCLVQARGNIIYNNIPQAAQYSVS